GEEYNLRVGGAQPEPAVERPGVGVGAVDHVLRQAVGLEERGVERVGGGPSAGPIVGIGTGVVVERHAAQEALCGLRVEGGDAEDQGAVERVPETAVFARARRRAGLLDRSFDLAGAYGFADQQAALELFVEAALFVGAELG